MTIDNEAWKVQVSFRTQLGAMINCRANSSEELDAELNVVQERIAAIHAIEQSLFAAGTVAAAMPLAPQQPVAPPPPPAPAPSPWGAPQTPAPGFPAPPSAGPLAPQPPAATAAPSPGAGQAPLCQHNLPAKWVAGGISRKSGKPYNGFWACPLDREQQCQMPR